MKLQINVLINGPRERGHIFIKTTSNWISPVDVLHRRRRFGDIDGLHSSPCGGGRGRNVGKKGVLVCLSYGQQFAQRSDGGNGRGSTNWR